MTSEQQVVSSNGAKKRTRSPAYPSIPLEEALQKAEIIRKAEGKNEAPPDAILDHWGVKPKSGGGMADLSALIKFGLLSDEGSSETRKVRLTPLALKILLDDRPESTERLTAVREAALNPTIHKELWQKYQGALPSDANIRHYLRLERSFLDDAAENLIQEFRSTLSYARLPESGIMSPQVEDKTPPDGGQQMASQSPAPLASPQTPAQPRGASPQNPFTQPAPTSQKQTHETRTLQIPFTDLPWGTLQVPYPMTDEAWDELEAFLSLMKRPLKGPTTKSEASGGANA